MPIGNTSSVGQSGLPDMGQFFGEVSSAVRAAWQKKHPSAAHVDDEPAQPRRKRDGPREVYTAGGFADVIVDREDGESIGEDAESDA